MANFSLDGFIIHGKNDETINNQNEAISLHMIVMSVVLCLENKQTRIKPSKHIYLLNNLVLTEAIA
jgi:hypothetical protein